MRIPLDAEHMRECAARVAEQFTRDVDLNQFENPHAAGIVHKCLAEAGRRIADSIRQLPVEVDVSSELN